MANIYIFLLMMNFYNHSINKSLNKIDCKKKGNLSLALNIDNDSCNINLNLYLFKKEYFCNVFKYVLSDKIILIDSNPDKTLIVYSIINKNPKNKIFEYYDSPTGRRKILLFDLSMKKIFLSDWFDDSATGDIIDVKTINPKLKTFDVYKTGIKKNRLYKVKFNLLKTL